MKKVLPIKHLRGEILEAGFIPKNELLFTVREIGVSRAEEKEAIKDFRELEHLQRGLVSELLSKQATQNLCNDSSSYGKMMRSLLSAGIVIRYNYYIGDVAVGIATITKNSRCIVK